MSYEIPASLPGELDELESLIGKYRAGTLDAASLKARRVPFGCYEQRKDGTYMVRVRTTGGALTPAQLRVLAVVCDKYGSDMIHITTRQEFQVHEVSIENVIAVMRELFSAGLSSRGGGGNTVRNIMISPDAGVSPEEVFDPSPYAFALTSRLISEADSWVLPRKFKITFSNSGKDTAYAQFNDLGFVAKIQDGVKGFKVYVAGGMGSKPEVAHLLHEFIPWTDTYVVAEAAKRLFDKHGNRKNKHAARLRFLWNQLGEARFRELYQNELDEVRRQPPAAFIVNEVDAQLTTPSITPAEVESPEYEIWKRRYTTVQRQPGLYSVLIPVLLGNLRTKDAIALADFLEGFGTDVVRATFGQNLRLRNISEAYLGNVYQLISAFSELSSAPALLANSIACTGADTCKLGICLSKGALAAIARKLAQSGLNLDDLADFKINLSGCPNTCGQHMLADLGFYGQVARKDQLMFPAYGVVAGAVIGDGKARLAKHIDRISSRDLPDFVVDLLKIYLEKKSRFASFDEYIAGEGEQDIRSICDRYRQIPEFEDDKSYYQDWGAEAAFSLVGKGLGECSAGLFDLIEVDLKQIQSLEKKLSGGLSGEERENALYQLALSSARMLLVTRGIEAHSDMAIFASFSMHFIKAGLVDAHFQSVINAAQSKDLDALCAGAADVLALAQEIKALYTSMDNSLRFPADMASKAGRSAASNPVQVERDYRGVACPMNFVKLKLDLARMQKGQTVRVLLDDGPPIENVPRSAAQEGHRVLEQTKTGNHWAVLIEKA
jgi:sulfite reductase beta subunit-like hemoprotein/TusA-related sulfurtransferase